MVAVLKMPKPLVDDSERRMFTRKPIQAFVEGTRLDHSISARQQPHVSLSLRDLSLGGLSATSDKPLDTGERVAVYFPPHGAYGGWDARGRVLRCHAIGAGYRIAVEFDSLPAA